MADSSNPRTPVRRAAGKEGGPQTSSPAFSKAKKLHKVAEKDGVVKTPGKPEDTKSFSKKI